MIEIRDTSDADAVDDKGFFFFFFSGHTNIHAQVQVIAMAEVYLTLTHNRGLFHMRKTENSGVEYL